MPDLIPLPHASRPVPPVRLPALPAAHARPPGRTAGLCLPGQVPAPAAGHAAQAGYPIRPSPGGPRPAGAMILEMPRVWFRNEQSLAQVVSDDNEVVAAARREPRHPVPDAAPGLFRDHRPLPGAADAHDGDVPPTAQDILAPLLETARNSSAVNAVPATMQGVREFVRAAPWRIGGHAARPGARRGRRRLGALLRTHGLHHDAAGQAGHANGRAHHPDRGRAPAGRPWLAHPLCARARAAAGRAKPRPRC